MSQPPANQPSPAQPSGTQPLRITISLEETLLESVEDYAILMMTHEGRIASWNSGAERTFGYTEEEIIGQPSALLFTPEDREKGEHQKEITEAFTKGRAEDERWHLRKDGSRFYASGVLRPLEGVEGFVKVCRDLTSRKKMEDELQWANNELQRAHEELQRTHDELEERVARRTAQLAHVAQDLHAEIAERQKVEQARERLLQRVVTAQEEERRRISRELHDQFGQQLTALSIGLQALPDLPDAGLRRPSYNQQRKALQGLVDSLMQQMHQLAWELRPAALDTFGLEPALRQYVQEWGQHSGLQADFITRGVSKAGRLPPEVETALYRVV